MGNETCAIMNPNDAKQHLLIVLPHLVKSGYLPLSSFINLHVILRQSWRLEDGLIYCETPSFGLQRYRLWSALLMLDPDFGSSCPASASALFNSHATTMSIASTKDSNESTIAYYLRLAEVDTNASSLSQGQIGEIVRDVVRTFPGHPFFKRGMIGERMLGRILQAVAAAYPNIGYCQGMNFVVGTLLLGRLPVSITGGIPKIYSNPNNPTPDSSVKLDQIDDQTRIRAECDCFTFMLSLMHPESKLAMSGLWKAGVPKMKLRVYQFDRLLRWTLPKLHSHFENIQLAPEILVAQWFITMFSYTLPLTLTMRIWDYILFGGWPAMYRVALSLMSFLEPQMLELDLEGIGLMMRDWKQGHSKTHLALVLNFGPETIFQKATSMLITSEVLQRLQEDFALEMISLCELKLSSNVGNSEFDVNGSALHSHRTANGVQLGDTASDYMSAAVSGFHSGVAAVAAGFTFPSGENSERRSSLTIGGPDNNFWLARYGEDFNPEVALELLKARDELQNIEIQTEGDKESLQAKILKACETCRAVELDMNNAKHQFTLFQDEKDMLVALLEAANLNAAQVAIDFNYTNIDWNSTDQAEIAGKSEDEGSDESSADSDEDIRELRANPPTKRRPSTNFKDMGLDPQTATGRNSFDRKSDYSVSSWINSITRMSRVGTPSPTNEIVQSDSFDNENDAFSEHPPIPLHTLCLRPQPLAACEPHERSVPMISSDTIDTPSSNLLQSHGSLAFKKDDITKTSRYGNHKRAESSNLFGSAWKAIGHRLKSGAFVRPFRSNRSASPNEPKIISDFVNDNTLHLSVSVGPGPHSPRSRRIIEEQSQLCQRRIIAIQRKLNAASHSLEEARTRESSFCVEFEEAKERKRSLCDQLQLVVVESNQRRSSKLADIAEKYSM